MKNIKSSKSRKCKKCKKWQKWENEKVIKMIKCKSWKQKKCVKILRLTPPMLISALKSGPVVPPGIEKVPNQAARISQSVDFGHLSDISAFLRGGHFLTLFLSLFHFSDFVTFCVFAFWSFSAFSDFCDFDHFVNLPHLCNKALM